MPNTRYVSLVAVLAVSIVGTLSAEDLKTQNPAQQPGSAVEPSKPIYDTQVVDVPRLSPEETVKTSRFPEGFQLQVAAQTPDIQQPIGMCWDSRGRLWVVENYTYSEKEMNFDVSLSDRILIFEDTDHDGTLDSRKIFWDQGKKITSIEIGYGGVWVMAPPNLLFIPDRNHDDLPDTPPHIVLDGFEHGSIRHTLANGLRWGPDGWLYGRHGIQAVSKVGPPGSSDLERTNFSCSIWRWHPIRKKLDIVCQGTTNPWGFDWDKHGQLFFINTVIGHLWHAIPGAHLQRMHGDDLESDIYELMPQVADHYHFDSGHEVWSDIRKLGVTPTTDLLGGGHAHCGMMIYQGNQWPEAYRDKLFTLNLHGRRINVERLDRQGAGFVGRHEPDMITFSDSWFRGIELSYGPDGSVFVLDWSDTGECHENDGIHRNSGTIYRIAYGEKTASSGLGDLHASSDAELLSGIYSSNGWLASQSRLILSERSVEAKLSSNVIRELETVIESDRNERRRLLALWTLAACGHDSPAVLRSLLNDPSEHIRLQAVHLLVDPSRQSEDATDAFLAMINRESSDLVCLHLAGAMQKAHGKSWWPVMMALCQRSKLANDRDYPLMLWYALKGRLGTMPKEGVALLSTLYSNPDEHSSKADLGQVGSSARFHKLAQFSARFLASRMHREPNAMAMLISACANGSAEMQADVLRGMQVGLQGRHRMDAPKDWDAFAKAAVKISDPEIGQILLGLQTLFGDGIAAEQLAKVVRDKKADTEVRRNALESLTESRVENVKELAYGQLRDQNLARQAIIAIMQVGNIEDAKKLVAFYPDKQIFRNGVVEVLLNSLASRREYLPVLFDAIESKHIEASLVNASLLRQMLMLDDPTISEKLGKLWPQTKLMGRERLTQIRALESKLTSDILAAADLGKGRVVWDKLCASCHKLYGAGGQIGPELTGAQRTNLRYLTENIIDPSATVAANYRISLILMDDGTLVSGVVLTEDDTSVTVQTAKERVNLVKSDIEERKASSQSLMPEGLLDALDDHARRDLVAYLMASRQVDAVE